MHLRGILWVFFRVLLVGFSLFRPGAARAPFLLAINRANISLSIYSIKVEGLVLYSKAAKRLGNFTIVFNKVLVEVIEA